MLRASASPTPYSGVKLHLNISVVTNGRACGISYEMLESESHLVVSDSLWPHGLYSQWNSPDQDTGVGSLSLLQGIFPTQGLNPGLPHCRQFLYQLSHRSENVLIFINLAFHHFQCFSKSQVIFFSFVFTLHVIDTNIATCGGLYLTWNPRRVHGKPKST